MNIYHQELLDHYRFPRHKGKLAHANRTSELHNPSCGDSISWQLTIDKEGHVTALAFEGKGCVISQATASMLAESVMNKSVSKLLELDAAFIIAMIGMELGPTRLKCALLSLEAMQNALQAFKPLQ